MTSAEAQNNLYGKWYTLSRNRVIEFAITKDSLVSRQLDWNLTPRINARNYYQAKPVKFVTAANGNIFLGLSEPLDSRQIGIAVFKITKQGKELQLLKSGEFKYTDSTFVKEYIQNFVNNEQALTFLSEDELNRLRKQPSIDSMTTDDFKLYTKHILQYRVELDSLSKSGNKPTTVLYYGYFLTRYLIGQVGYNPLVTEEQFSRLIKRFESDPSTKELVKQLDL